MHVFICHASEDKSDAERIHYALTGAGYTTFFDRTSLLAGLDYDSLISAEIERCHVFVFLISQHSVATGNYSLSELDQAESRWPHPSGFVLPVFVVKKPPRNVPQYLRAAVALHRKGDIGADVLSAVKKLVAQRAKGASPKGEESTPERAAALERVRQRLIGLVMSSNLYDAIWTAFDRREPKYEAANRDQRCRMVVESLLGQSLRESLIALVKVRNGLPSMSEDIVRCCRNLRAIALMLLPTQCDEAGVDELRQHIARGHLMVALPTPSETVAEGFLAAAHGKDASLRALPGKLPVGETNYGNLRYDRSPWNLTFRGVESGIDNLADHVTEHLAKSIGLGGETNLDKINAAIANRTDTDRPWYIVFESGAMDEKTRSYCLEQISAIRTRLKDLTILELCGTSSVDDHRVADLLKQLIDDVE